MRIPVRDELANADAEHVAICNLGEGRLTV
jgi:hypothetical protein